MTSSPAPDLEELERLAKAALDKRTWSSIDLVQFERAASPDVILALITELRAAREAAAESGRLREALREASIALAGPPDDAGIKCEETLQRAPAYPPCPRQAVNLAETNYSHEETLCKLHTTVVVRSGGKLIRPLTQADYEAAQEGRRQEREDWWRDKADRLLDAALLETPPAPSDHGASGSET